VAPKEKLDFNFNFDLIPRRATVIYFACGLVWVAASEILLPSRPLYVSLLNRTAFVAVSAVAFYLVLDACRRRIKVIESGLQEAIGRATAYFDSAQWGIISIDREGLIRRANPKAQELFGYTSEELAGQSIDMLIPERIRARHADHRKDYFAAPRNRPMGIGMDLTARRKDGSEFPVEVSLHFIATDTGGVVSAFISDISERLKLEREARRGETLTALGAVAAGVAHELNNPLAVVSSRIELMMQTGASELSPQMREDLEVVRRNAARASQIASELLNSARQRRLERQPVNLNDLIDETVLLFREQFRRDAIALKVSAAKALPAVKGDRGALGQVLINLLSNARDALGANGEIRISAAAAPDRPGFVQLRVEDSGPGIPPEAKAKIFDVFYTTKNNGTGLGLWLSRRIVLEHQGWIEVESEPGRGTAFTITLPAAPGDQGATARVMNSRAMNDSRMPEN
jgi:PAS domain S-box-containing protein